MTAERIVIEAQAAVLIFKELRLVDAVATEAGARWTFRGGIVLEQFGTTWRLGVTA